MWRIEQRIERLNDLGFDVDELDIVTDFDGDRVRIQPKVVEAGHHQRELQGLTGLHVEDAQARRLLNDLASYTAALQPRPRGPSPGREPLARRDLRADRRDDPGRRAAASSSPRRSSTRCSRTAGTSPSRPATTSTLFEAAADYIATVLKHKPDEAITSAPAAVMPDA